jgi:hypothetical protein
MALFSYMLSIIQNPTFVVVLTVRQIPLVSEMHVALEAICKNHFCKKHIKYGTYYAVAHKPVEGQYLPGGSETVMAVGISREEHIKWTDVFTDTISLQLALDEAKIIDYAKPGPKPKSEEEK